MTSISYNYNNEYTTKWKHFLAWYVSTVWVLNCRLYVRLDGLMDKALDLRIRGREFESRYGQEFFIL